VISLPGVRIRIVDSSVTYWPTPITERTTRVPSRWFRVQYHRSLQRLAAWTKARRTALTPR
jgi:hypothetical protein